VITGPTAAGKSRAALDTAHELLDRGIPACIISMDSVQVYRHMDIGTDKLKPEQREGVPHHLIDVVMPDQTFSAAQFAAAADEIINAAWQKGGAAILAGGTGFYLRSLLWGLFPGPSGHPEVRDRLYHDAARLGLAALHKRLAAIDAEAASRIHPNDHVRIIRALEVFELTGLPISGHFKKQGRQGPRYPAVIIGLALPREKLYERINTRVDQMMEQGLVEEVKKLREMGYGPGLASQQALGYKQVHAMLDQGTDLGSTVYLIKRDTRHYSRRQLTWLRKEKGLDWMEAGQNAMITKRIVSFLEEGKK
jgi:tRNA dimethylallyltransferase